MIILVMLVTVMLKLILMLICPGASRGPSGRKSSPAWRPLVPR